jgi:hypothetical protein
VRILQIDHDTVKLIDELREIRDRAKADGKREDDICEVLKSLSDRQPAALKFRLQVVAQIEEGRTSSIDAKALRAAHPELAEQFTRTSMYLKVKPC